MQKMLESILSGLAKPILKFARETLAMVAVELRKVMRDPTEILTRAVQPTLWLIIFGQVFNRIHAIPTYGIDYLSYITPGILAQSVLFSAIFYGIAIIWERDLGIVNKLLVTPAYRNSLVFGKAISAGIRGISQGVIVYVIAFFLDVRLQLNIASIVGVIFFIVLGSALFSTFSLVIACIVKTRERFMGIGQVLTMPLFFASNAIYPIKLMPHWLQYVAILNPITYLVDALRKFMLVGGHNIYNIGTDFAVLGSIFILLLILAAKLYPTIIN